MPECSIDCGYVPRPWRDDGETLTNLFEERCCNGEGDGGGSGTTPGTFMYGNGSPEGVVVADRGQTYIDVAGDTFWMKKTGDGTNTLWIQMV